MSDDRFLHCDKPQHDNMDKHSSEDKESKINEKKVPLQHGATKIGLHSLKNILGDKKQLSLFRNQSLQNINEQYGIRIETAIDRFGINLNDTQFRVMEGILKGFTETNYQGNLSPKNKSELAREKYRSNDLPAIYKNTATIPRLVATQAQILEWGGFNKTSIAEKERAIEALNYLGVTQFCFYYDRLSYDENGQPAKNKSGGWLKEEVTAIDTLFTIKEVRDEKTRKLKYYEILPSPIFLDQTESYFMLIPFGWREEVQKVLGKKRISSYTFRFLLFLRYQYELKRRSKQPLELRKSWEEVAVAIKMPETVYKRKKERANQLLEEAYSIAKALGYLSDYKRSSEFDSLFLKEDKYYNPERFLNIDSSVKPIPLASEESKKLFDFFYGQKLKIDSKLKIPIGEPRNLHLRAFDQLLRDRSLDDIKKTIQWALNRGFWCARVGTPSKLRDHFSEAWSEMINSSDVKEDRSAANKKYAQDLIEELKSKIPKNVRAECLNKYVELVADGSQASTVINYDEKGFVEQLENGFRKFGICLA